jgi:hypothetical protein
VDTGPCALAIRVSSLACEVYRVLLVAIIVVYLRPYITSAHITIGATMDREAIRRQQKSGALMIVPLWWNTNFG